jgi:REP element-mobilizing transposase RayT
LRATDKTGMAYTNLLFHIVFGTKERFPFINSDLRPEFYRYMAGIVKGLGGIVLEIGGIEDHVHLLVKLNPTLCLSDFLRDLKSNSSAWAKQNGIRKFAWQRRYGAFTVSESQRDIVRKYIQNQEKHHKKFDFRTEFETMLTSNAIPIDDYVWQD